MQRAARIADVAWQSAASRSLRRHVLTFRGGEVAVVMAAYGAGKHTARYRRRTVFHRDSRVLGLAGDRHHIVPPAIRSVR